MGGRIFKCYTNRNGEKRTITVLCAVVASLVMLYASYVTAQSQSKEILIDRIAAVVNGEAILASEIEVKVRSGSPVSVSYYPALEGASNFEKALQDNINFRIIAQRAEDLGIAMDDSDVEKEIENFLKMRNLTREGLVEALEQQGTSYDSYFEEFKNQLLLRTFQVREIGPRALVSNRDVQAYYETTSGKSDSSVVIDLRQISFYTPQNATKVIEQELQNRAELVHQKLQGGMDFIEAVKLYSDDVNSKANDGLMKGLHLSDLATNIKEVVSKLEDGRFTAPIKTPLGFSIFYMVAKTYGKNPDLDKKFEELRNELRAKRMQEESVKWLQEQRKRSKIEILKS